MFAPFQVVLLAGVAAALHIGKLPPAIPALQQALGLTLVQAGFLLSLVQLAGMAAGVAFGSVADGLGLRRSMVVGLVALGAASIAGAFATGAASLMGLRAAEGFGFLLVVLPAPPLLRQLTPPQRTNAVLGLWGAYMPLATALALLLGPLAITHLGWRGWWAVLGVSALAMALAVARTVPPRPASARPTQPFIGRLQRTLSAPGPWWVACTFAPYSAQWLAVIGFLPSIYLQAGVPGAATGVLTAAASAANIAGNVGAGRLLQRGVPAPRLLTLGFVTMGVAGVAAFAGDPGLSPAARYAAVLVFSAVGGLIPSSLFSLAVRAAPGDAMLGTTIGWVQQWSAFGQFAGPPAVAALASASGGWQHTWMALLACGGAGLALTAGIARWLARRAPAA